MSRTKEQLSLLVGCGRELGSVQIDNAIKSAKTPEQMDNQIFTLQIASQHILAVCSFNLEKQNGRAGNLYIDDLCAEIKKELEWLRTQDMELYMQGEPT